MKDLSEQAEYIGEDGDMVANAKNEEEALEMFKRRWVEDCGEEDWNDFIGEVNIEEAIGIAWVHLASKKFSREHDDCEWYVSHTDSKGLNRVYYFIA